ncbi:M16 family metallopeptidase [Spongorhabdus nitratireducens]
MNKSVLRPLLLLLMLQYLFIQVLQAGVAVAATNSQTQAFVLENGMKLIVREDHRAPVAVVQVWYKVGSSYEPAGLTGVSHMLEHMMFKGSNALESGEFGRRLREVGGKCKSRTCNDYTYFYEVVAKDRLPMVMAMEAERMLGLKFSDDEFRKEIQVVREERRLRVEDRPVQVLRERFMTQAFPASNYSNTVEGWECDLERLKVKDIARWYRHWYQPKNAIVVVVGDVNPDEVRTLAGYWFGRLLHEKTVPAKHLPSLPEPGKRQLDIVDARARVPVLMMGFNVPALTTAEVEWEPWALRMLVGVLDGGRSARMESGLVLGAEVASKISATYNPISRGDTLLEIVGVTNVGLDKTLEELEAGILSQIRKIQEKPPEPEEMERVRRQLVARLVYEQDSIISQARKLGMLECVGLSWKLADQDLLCLQEVTAKQVQAVARRYLIPARMSVARLRPAVDAYASAQSSSGSSGEGAVQ